MCGARVACASSKAASSAGAGRRAFALARATCTSNIFHSSPRILDKNRDCSQSTHDSVLLTVYQYVCNDAVVIKAVAAVIVNNYLHVYPFTNRSEVGQVFALSWLITWYGHVLKDFTTIVRLYDFFLATHPLMPVYFGAAVSMFIITLTLKCLNLYLTNIFGHIQIGFSPQFSPLLKSQHFQII